MQASRTTCRAMMIGQLLLYLLLLHAFSGSSEEVTLEVSTTPPRAEVVIDGRSAGLSPLIVSGLEPGTHHVEVIPPSSQGWGIQPVDSTVNLTASHTRLILYLPGTLHITSNSRGALVLEGGRPLGYTPLMISKAAGEALELTVESSGAIPYHWEWMPTAGSRQEIHVNPFAKKHPAAHAEDSRLPTALYVGAAGLVWVVSSIICSHEADVAYDRYHATADTSRMKDYYDRAVLLDKCAGFFWASFQVTVVGALAWWMLS